MVHISERELELPDAVIGKLIGMKRKDVVSLGPGEPDFSAPLPIVNYTKKIAHLVNHYSPPGGMPELKEGLVKKLRKDNRIKTEPENIIVTAGSQEAMLIAIANTLDVSEQIIIPNPSFLAYVPMAELFDAFPVSVELKEENKFEINPDDVKKLIDPKKTEAILINTPANPTGNVIRRKTLEELADMAIEHNLYIFSDEAYEKIVYEKRHVSIGSLNGMQDYVVTFQSFSKSYAMCGYRIGYCVAPKELAETIANVHVYTSICAPTISQLLAKKALSLGNSYTKRMVKEYKKRRNFIVKRLNEIGLRTIMPQGAFYTFSNVGHLTKDCRKFSYELLNKAKVAVVPGTEFGSYGEGYIRCSYATSLKEIEKAMNRMEDFLRKM